MLKGGLSMPPNENIAELSFIKATLCAQEKKKKKLLQPLYYFLIPLPEQASSSEGTFECVTSDPIKSL